MPLLRPHCILPQASMMRVRQLPTIQRHATAYVKQLRFASTRCNTRTAAAAADVASTSAPSVGEYVCRLLQKSTHCSFSCHAWLVPGHCRGCQQASGNNNMQQEATGPVNSDRHRGPVNLYNAALDNHDMLAHVIILLPTSCATIYSSTSQHVPVHLPAWLCSQLEAWV